MVKPEKVLAGMRVEAKRGARLSKTDTGCTPGMKDKDDARRATAKNIEKMSGLQYKLYAEAKQALLVVFQAMDTAGKDGVIRKVFGPLNPQGVEVTSFKRPTAEELSRGYLWRIARAVPAKGMIGIFNRSQYEDVLVHKVHKLIDSEELDMRYRQINDFERYLAENGVTVVKFFLHISKDEQKRRLQSRLENPDKRWKFEAGDLTERKFWDKYMEAYEDVLAKCSSKRAAWHVIPSDNKWYRDWAVSGILLDALERMNPKFPKEQPGLDKLKVE